MTKAADWQLTTLLSRPTKGFLPISSTEVGTHTDSSDRQRAKASSPMRVTVAGMATLRR